MSNPRGYSLPLSPGGTASLVPAPPWHYVGDFLVIEYWAEPAAVAAVLPEGIEPFAEDPGRCAALFVDWQSCSEGGDELVDPARGQYKEFFVVVTPGPRRRGGHDVPVHLGRPRLRARARVDPGLPEEARADRDDAVVRPRLPGRGADVRRRVLGARASDRAGDGHARARVRVGADAQRSAAREPPPLPAAGVGPPRRPGRQRAGAARSSDRSISAIHEGPATLELHDAPGEEHAALAPVRVGKGFRFTFAYTVDDLETV